MYTLRNNLLSKHRIRPLYYQCSNFTIIVRLHDQGAIYLYITDLWVRHISISGNYDIWHEDEHLYFVFELSFHKHWFNLTVIRKVESGITWAGSGSVSSKRFVIFPCSIRFQGLCATEGLILYSQLLNRDDVKTVSESISHNWRITLRDSSIIWELLVGKEQACDTGWPTREEVVGGCWYQERLDHPVALIAQSVEHRSINPRVVDSMPTQVNKIFQSFHECVRWKILC